VKSRDMVQQYQHPALGYINCVGHPVKFRHCLSLDCICTCCR
jgi:hypothetical protein